MPEIGDKVVIEKIISEKDIEKFAELSGDYNPIHMDESFASKTFFRGRIAHGLIAASLISAGLTKLFGNGNIWLSQMLEFKAPVRIGETITSTLEISGKEAKNVYRVKTICTNMAGNIVLDGEARTKPMGA